MKLASVWELNAIIRVTIYLFMIMIIIVIITQ